MSKLALQAARLSQHHHGCRSIQLSWRCCFPYHNQEYCAHQLGAQHCDGLPSITDTFLYDGEGQRVEQSWTTNGTTTTTLLYIGGSPTTLEKLNLSNGTITSLYEAQGQRIARNVHGTFLELGADGLGSVTAVLTPTGTLSRPTACRVTCRQRPGRSTNAENRAGMGCAFPVLMVPAIVRDGSRRMPRWRVERAMQTRAPRHWHST